MRRVRHEAWEVAKIWWLIVPGFFLGVFAIVQAIEDAHAKTVWMLATFAVAALWLATCVRLHEVLKERDAAQRLLQQENSADAVASRLDGLGGEFASLLREIEEDEDAKPTPGPLPAREIWERSYMHLAERVRSELRTNARGLTKIWAVNPDPLPARDPFVDFARAYCDLAVAQLSDIADQARKGDVA
jgi:hypothetical protein